MKLRLIILLFFFGFYTQSIKAQSTYIDSLDNVLQTTKSDSLKIDVLHKLSSAYSDSSYSKSLDYLQQAIIIANKNGDRPEIALIYHKMGYFFYNKGEFNYALREYKNALGMYEVINDSNSIGESYNDIGLVYKNWGKYEDALEAFLKGLSVFENNGNEVGIAMVANNIGQIYYYRSEYIKAIRYFEKYLNVNQKTNNKRAVAGAANNIAAAYMELKNYDLALENYQKALTIYDSLDVQVGVAILSDNIGMLYALTGNFEVSITFHQRAQAIFEKMNSFSRESHTLKNLGYSYYKLGNYSKSIEYLLKGKELAKKSQQPEIEKEVYFHLSASYEALNKPTEALRYYKLMFNIKDSLLSSETKRNLDAKEREFEASKSEREYNYMHKKLEEQSTYQNILGIIVLLFLLILLLLLIDNIFKNKKIRKYKQRKSFLLKILNQTLNNLGVNSQSEVNPNIKVISSNSIKSDSNAEVINITTPNFIVIVTLFTASYNENSIIIKTFLYNEVSLFIKNTPNFSAEQLDDLINSKLLYINTLFDSKKKEIYKNIFVYNSQSQHIAYIGKCKTIWYSNENQLLPITSSQQIIPQPNSNNESALYLISQIGSQNTSLGFNAIFEKTAAEIFDVSFSNRVEVLNNAIESAKLCGMLETSIVLVVVNITGAQPVEVRLLN